MIEVLLSISSSSSTEYENKECTVVAPSNVRATRLDWAQIVMFDDTVERLSLGLNDSQAYRLTVKARRCICVSGGAP